MNEEEIKSMREWFEAWSLREGERIVFLSGMDKALAGKAFVKRSDKMRWVPVYDYSKLVDIVQENDPDMEDPWEYVDSNMVYSYVGPNTPVINFGMTIASEVPQEVVVEDEEDVEHNDDELEEE